MKLSNWQKSKVSLTADELDDEAKRLPIRTDLAKWWVKGYPNDTFTSRDAALAAARRRWEDEQGS